VRRKALFAATESEIVEMIERGQLAEAEDFDPDVEINPVQVHLIEQEQAAERRATLAAKRATLAAKKAKKKAPKPRPQGLLPRMQSTASGFLEVGAFAKLGIHISFKKKPHGDSSPKPATGTRGDEVDLKAIDVRLAKHAAPPAPPPESMEDRIFREAEEAAREASDAQKQKRGWFGRK